MLRLVLILFLLGSILCPLNVMALINITQVGYMHGEENYRKNSSNKIIISNNQLVIKVSRFDLYKKAINYVQQWNNIVMFSPSIHGYLLQKITTDPVSLVKVSVEIIKKNSKQKILKISSSDLEGRWKTKIRRYYIWNIRDYLLNLYTYKIKKFQNIYKKDCDVKIFFFSLLNKRAQGGGKYIESFTNRFRFDSSQLDQVPYSYYNNLEHVSAESSFYKLITRNTRVGESSGQRYYDRYNFVQSGLAFIGKTEKYYNDIPRSLSAQLTLNHELLLELKKQRKRMETVLVQKTIVTRQVIQARQVLATIIDQSQWISISNTLGEALRSLVSRLPKMPKPQQFGTEMAELRAKRLYYLALLEKKVLLQERDPLILTSEQKNILTTQLKIQHKILMSLVASADALSLELTKLNISNTHLIDALKRVKDASHRYLFWTSDISALNFRYPIELVYDLRRLLSLDTFGQLSRAMIMMCTTRDTIVPLFIASLLVGLSVSLHRHFCVFLDCASRKVGKVTQDQFSLTIRTVFWSILVALPLPVLFAALGYGLQHSWPYPIAIAIGYGVTASVPLLWGFMICNTFSRSKGLFIVHFRWPRNRVALAMRFYRLCIGVVVPLMMMLISFENLSDREFSPTLGRFCFILICGALSLVTVSLKHAGIPLYLDKDGNSKNVMNNILWNVMVTIPIMAAIASCVGYLETSKALLARLETSLAIWFLLLVMYYIIRRWMLIQRRRIAFDRARSRRADILAYRARNEEELGFQQSVSDNIEVEEPRIDLDAISAQSLRLVRSLLTLVALVSVILIWSEIHSAFSFLENIRLWDVSTTMQGVKKPQPITLGSVMNATLVLIITAQLVRNMPALLELALLQHLSLTPGTGYAITTLTKYFIVLIGSLTGFTLIGIDWSKLQWLVAGLSVGLGFGLQEIFANFISGLILLFEKPIRIGDTVTIRDLTGSITRINTRATTITDWDHKEIIVPNKSFLTEQFINWSLSDSITRVVLNISVSLDANSEVVTQVLLKAAKGCRYVLENPYPEAFLVDLQKGVQLFELRIYAAEMNHRMLLRHEIHRRILLGFRELGVKIPFPIFQV
ncbi:Miniconductance mechanosensitive channel MscM [Candidatus Erwinia haradaeae]|uniref:Miniconductance mechanosensitive channel MscM, partial n=1 Tax=Candidatus Erwinia haradaeae TaxID=1922217 RepID=A0A803GCN3_9GAMM|nr:miniconductance mechanosensitive channel MscM [Candidatus Erwinia haradaeae]VFP88346.1 Miniconductance mechanosensitive channel MscM [Candidatus Erwinia haradaeae]